MIQSMEFIERRNSMSFNYAYLCHDFLVMGSDSRESFEDGTYNDNRQKTFVNHKQKLCWSFTGLTTIEHINNIEIVNSIMNSSASIINKLQLIQHMMCYQTKKYYENYRKDAIFDMFVGMHTDSEILLYTLEVKNGQSPDEHNKVYSQSNLHHDFAISSGVHTELYKTVCYSDMDSDPINTTQNLIKKAINTSEKTDKTVGGKSYIVLMDKAGKMITYIDGKEKDFG